MLGATLYNGGPDMGKEEKAAQGTTHRAAQQIKMLPTYRWPGEATKLMHNATHQPSEATKLMHNATHLPDEATKLMH